MSEALHRWIQLELGEALIPDSQRPVPGGCIHDSNWWDCQSGRSLFIKKNKASFLDVFEAESKGLELLRSTDTVRIPEPLAFGCLNESAYLVMEAIPLHPSQGHSEQQALGQQLAKLHQCVDIYGRFGASFDNHIGATPQQNSLYRDWAEFFLYNRLGYQFELAASKGWQCEERSDLEDAVRPWLEQEIIAPTLVHGDLWSGNVGFDDQGRPVLFDPACYYGDPETDVAFTKMFGGFGSAFYDAYREVHPATPVTDKKHRLYNLYHELNHWNLFGGEYRRQAEETIRSLL